MRTFQYTELDGTTVPLFQEVICTVGETKTLGVRCRLCSRPEWQQHARHTSSFTTLGPKTHNHKFNAYMHHVVSGLHRRIMVTMGRLRTNDEMDAAVHLMAIMLTMPKKY